MVKLLATDVSPTASAAPTAAAPKETSAAKAQPAGKVSDSKAAALAKEAEAMNMQMLGMAGAGPATQGVLNRSDIPPQDLSGVAASAAGTNNQGGDLRLGSGGGGLVQPGKAGDT